MKDGKTNKKAARPSRAALNQMTGESSKPILILFKAAVEQS
ncbi:MAG: hypothetical protein ABJB17_10930 [Burkholderiales bacterium]